MKYIIIVAMLFVMAVSAVPVNAALSIPFLDKDAENWNGYWQFEYDPNDPITAAMYCCQWEMIHGHLSKYSDVTNESSDDSSSSSSSSVETKSYCPACHVYDDEFATLEIEPELQELSDELMETKPWLKEGKNDDNIISDTTNNTSTKSIMSFSDPVKI